MADLAVILLAEDREDDVLLIQRAFERARITTTLHVVRDGEEAIAYLSGSGKYSNRDEYPLPWLVLMDLKMPRVDGFEVLKWVRKEPGLTAVRAPPNGHTTSPVGENHVPPRKNGEAPTLPWKPRRS